MTKADMILDCETCREEFPDREDFFAKTERESADELWFARKHLPEELQESLGLTRLSCREDLSDHELFMELVYAMASGSVYDFRVFPEDFLISVEMQVDNAFNFPASILIDLTATLWHVTSGLPMSVTMVFHPIAHLMKSPPL